MNASATYRFLPPELADRLRGLGLAVRKPLEGTLQGQHRSPHLGASVEFAEYRDYVRGDPVALIDWAVYARSDRHVIRRFVEETNLRAYLLVDTSRSMGFREKGALTKLEFACFLAAGLMFMLVGQGDAAGLATFDGAVRAFFEPARSQEGLRPLLLHLESLAPSGPSRIEAALHEVAGRLRARSLVIVLSDLLEAPEDILRGLRHLQHGGHEITLFHLLDGAERRPTFDGVNAVQDLETGRRLVVDMDELKPAYESALERYLETLRRGCADGLADYLQVDTAVPVEEAIRRRATRA